MLQNSKLLEKLATEDYNFAEKLINAIKKAIESLRNFFKENPLEAKTEYGQALLKAMNKVENRVQELWDKAVAEGIRAEKAESGEVKQQARYRKNKNSQGVYSNRTIDDYTRVQYNNYGWVVINKVLTVNELNRFYKQFADKKALKYNYKMSADGYYMIPTGDVSMVDSKIVFVSGTLQNPYIDRVIEVTGIDDNEKVFYINEVIDNEEYDSSYSDIETYAGKGVFSTYTQTDFASYGELKRRYNTESDKNPSKQGGRERNSKTSTDSIKSTDRFDTNYLSAVERGDMATAQKMVDEAAKAAWFTSPKLYHGTKNFGFTEFDLVLKTKP